MFSKISNTKLATHLSTHRSALHWIASARQCGQHKLPEAYNLNMLMHCADPIRSLSVHQSEHYFVPAQCGQLFCHFCLPRSWTGIFYITLNKMLLSSTYMRLAAHMPHAHAFTVISRLALCHLYLHNVPRADIVHVLHMRSADIRPRADTLEVYCWF